VIVPISVVDAVGRANELAAGGTVTPLSVALSCTAPPLGVVITPLPAVESVPPVITAAADQSAPLSRQGLDRAAGVVEGAAIGAGQLQRRAIGRLRVPVVDHPVRVRIDLQRGRLVGHDSTRHW